MKRTLWARGYGRLASDVRMSAVPGQCCTELLHKSSCNHEETDVMSKSCMTQGS